MRPNFVCSLVLAAMCVTGDVAAKLPVPIVFVSGNTLLGECQSQQGMFFCVGYVLGMLSTTSSAPTWP